jgi:hypothetical protein
VSAGTRGKHIEELSLLKGEELVEVDLGEKA